MSNFFNRTDWVRCTAWFLAVTYAAGALWTIYLEHGSQVLSLRFGYSSAFIYLTCVVQLICVVGVLVPRFAPWAAAVLTVITVGAIASHINIGSPRTAGPAVLYTVVQIWFGLKSRARNVAVRESNSIS